MARLQPWRRGGVDAITSDLFISQRQLRRRCVAALGFGPKTLHRILRFQGFLALTHAFHRREVGLGWLAAAAGYFDQAHLTRECLSLAGLTPAALVKEMRESCGANHDHHVSFAGPRRALVTTRVGAEGHACAGVGRRVRHVPFVQASSADPRLASRGTARPHDDRT